MDGREEEVRLHAESRFFFCAGCSPLPLNTRCHFCSSVKPTRCSGLACCPHSRHRALMAVCETEKPAPPKAYRRVTPVMPCDAAAARQVSSEFFMREVLGVETEWGVLAWDVAGRGISYMLLEAAAYLFMVS